jgi:hypothetical protein
MRELAEAHRIIEGAIDAFGIDAFAEAIRARRALATPAERDQGTDPRTSLIAFFSDPEQAKALEGATGELAHLGVQDLVDRILDAAMPRFLERARAYGYAKPLAPEKRADKTPSPMLKDAALWLMRKLRPRPGVLHRLQLQLRIRGRALAIAAAATSARAMRRHELGLSADYFQLLKTSCSFWSNWWRLRGGSGSDEFRPDFLLLLKELFVLEPLRHEAATLKLPKRVRAIERLARRFSRERVEPVREDQRRLYTFARTDDRAARAGLALDRDPA